jgi:hypothetical protein
VPDLAIFGYGRRLERNQVRRRSLRLTASRDESHAAIQFERNRFAARIAVCLFTFVRIIVETHLAGMAACLAPIDVEDPLVGCHDAAPCWKANVQSVMSPVISTLDSGTFSRRATARLARSVRLAPCSGSVTRAMNST